MHSIRIPTKTYLDAANTPRDGVGDAVSNQLAININIIFFDRSSERGHINRHVDDAKERKGEHGRDGAN